MIEVETQNSLDGMPPIINLFTNWSASRIERMLQCGLKEYNTHHHDPPLKLPTYANLTQGKFLHSLIENFWNEKGEPKYKKVESFEGRIKGNWKMMIKRSTLGGQFIEWKSKEEPWIYLHDTLKIASTVYESCLKRGPPVFAEYYFYFALNGVKLRGSIDELRKNAMIVDHKTYMLSYDPEKPWNKADLDEKIQFTVYALATAASAYLDEDFASKLEIEVDRKLPWKENLEKINSQLNLKMHLLRKGEFVDIKRRSIAQINELFPLIKNLDEQTTKNIFTANRGYQCLHCPAYKPCYNDRENGLLPLPKRNGQVALFRDEDIKPFPGPIDLRKSLYKKKRQNKIGRQLRLPFGS